MLSRQDDAFFPRWYLCTLYNRAKRAAFTTIPNKWKAFRGYSIAARGSMSMAPKGS